MGYLLYLAWRIANASPPREVEAEARPLRFVQVVAFQWVNPKAWSMALGAITLYAPSRDLAAILLVAGTYVALGVPSATIWTTLGTGVRRFLDDPKRLRLFNWGMAVALILSMALVLKDYGRVAICVIQRHIGAINDAAVIYDPLPRI